MVRPGYQARLEATGWRAAASGVRKGDPEATPLTEFLPERRLELLREAADALRAAERPVRVLRSLAWAPHVRERFEASGARELPRPEYVRLDPEPTLAATDRARRLADADHPVDAWIRRQADAIADGARMLSAPATRAFHECSTRLYGGPRVPLPLVDATPLGLAERVRQVVDSLTHLDLGAPPPACHLADGIAHGLRKACRRFGDDAPRVEVVDELSANAVAGPTRILVRRSACFTDRDLAQLVHHEAFVHVATGLNGRAQDRLPLLAAGHPGTTRTQEGLAVFAEMISGSMDPDRMRRLADRTLAIAMAEDGADFLDVHRWFLERTGSEDRAFENARRVFRGGVLTGGAPFTKDGVYLDGLLRVHDFLRAAVAGGRADLVRLLFAGKLDLSDLPALAHLAHAGLLRQPRHLPPWAEDLRFLVAYLAYSAFLATVDLGRADAHYEQLLSRAPRVEFRAPVADQEPR